MPMTPDDICEEAVGKAPLTPAEFEAYVIRLKNAGVADDLARSALDWVLGGEGDDRA